MNMNNLLQITIHDETGESFVAYMGDSEIYDIEETIELLEQALTLVKQIYKKGKGVTE